MALHGELKVNGEVIGRWTAQRILTRQSGRHAYRWEAWEHGQHVTGAINHRYDDGAMALAASVLKETHRALRGPMRKTQGQITTAAELDALPVGSVVRWAHNGCVWEKSPARRLGEWVAPGGWAPYPSAHVASFPTVVLYRPDAPRQEATPQTTSAPETAQDPTSGSASGPEASEGRRTTPSVERVALIIHQEWDRQPNEMPCKCTLDDLEPDDRATLTRQARAVLELITPRRCAPSEDEVRRAILGYSGPLATHYGDIAIAAARAVAKLYGDQPTMAQAKAEAYDEGFMAACNTYGYPAPDAIPNPHHAAAIESEDDR